MVKLDIPFDAANLSGGITMYALVDAGLESAGLSNDGSLSVFSKSTSYSLDASKIKSESPITWRQVIMWCCQCAGVCGFADGNGYIHFGFYKKYTPGILQTENAETLETENGQPILLDGASEGAFRLPPSARFIDNTSLEEADTVLTGHQFKDGDKLYPENAVMQYGLQTEGNLVFSALKNETAKIYFAKRANNAVAGFTYRPYKCNILAFPQLQLLDSIDYVLGDVYHHSIITNYTFRLNGFMNIEAKAKSQVQKGWASLGALTANQKAIIDSVSQKVDTTRDQLSSYENALLLFNEKMLRSMGLYKTAENDPNGGVILYFHDKEKLKDSGTIYMFGSAGFAWTTGGWKNGNPVWHYGFTSTGDAILNKIQTYKLSAELIETGFLRSQNGASWINMDNGTFCFGNATGSNYENRLVLTENNELLFNGTIVDENGNNILKRRSTGLDIGDIRDSQNGLSFVYILAKDQVWLFADNILANDTSLATTSDARLKSDIKAISSDSRFLSFFDYLTPSSFKYTEGKSGRTHMGLIAQQVEQAATKAGLDINDIAAYVKSEAHRDNLDGYELALRYDEFVGLIIAKVQDLSAKVEKQTQEIAQLKAEISALKS